MLHAEPRQLRHDVPARDAIDWVGVQRLPMAREVAPLARPILRGVIRLALGKVDGDQLGKGGGWQRCPTLVGLLVKVEGPVSVSVGIGRDLFRLRRSRPSPVGGRFPRKTLLSTNQLNARRSC